MFIDEIREFTEENKNNKYKNTIIQIKNKIYESAKVGLNSAKYHVSNSCVESVVMYLESELFACDLNEKIGDSSISILTISW